MLPNTITMSTFKAFKVNAALFAYFDYPPFLVKNKEFYGTMYSQYKVGDVVYIKDENAVGVVLGCIDEASQDLRTDMSGMQCYSNLEFYNPSKHTTAEMTPSLREELSKQFQFEDEAEEPDLFDTPELIPTEVQDILNEWEENAGFYNNCAILVERLNDVGYTCDYDLSAEVYGLKKLK